MNSSLFVVTGTDTGVGKTVLACLLTHYLRARDVGVAGLKPVCSGDRQDARGLQVAAGGVLSLAEVNPWHFRAAFAPRIAARREERVLSLGEVLAHVRQIERKFPTLIIEGAGGLLSPLGEEFDSRDLITALRATPIVVCPNRLGAINQSLLILAALPRRFSSAAQIVLPSPERPDRTSRVNVQYLAGKLGLGRVHAFPWLKHPEQPGRSLANPRVRRAMRKLVEAIVTGGAMLRPPTRKACDHRGAI